MKKIIFIITILLTNYQAFTQNLTQRIKTEKSFVVLKNENNILPFIRLDTLNFGFEALSKKDSIFLKSILRYDKIDKRQNANIEIYCIYSKNIDLQRIDSQKDAVICLFGESREAADYFAKQKNVKAIIYSPLTDSLTIDYCGQLLFGAFSVDNKLNSDLSQNFKAGYGLKLNGEIRFKYTIPQEAGLDSAFIFSKIDSIVNFAIAIKAMPGCQIFAAKDKKVFLCKSYGYQTYDSLTQVSCNNVYDLASVTKIAASAPCLMLLNQEGKFDLNAKFSKYWPAFRFSNKKNLTVIDALCHQGRLTAWIPFWKNFVNADGTLKSKYFSDHPTKKFNVQVADSLYTTRKTKRKIYKKIKKSALLPKKKYKYSDLSFYLYPEIVKKLMKTDFEDCLNNNFYHKLGADNIFFNPQKHTSIENIVPTERDSVFRHQLIHGYVHDEGAALLGGVSGHAGLFANANDLAKLMQMYLDYGTYGGVRFLDSNIVKNWTSYQFADKGNRRGIVFDKPLLTHKERGTPSPLASDASFGHSGFTGTFTWADPENGLLFVFLSNRVYPTRKNKKLLHYNIRTNIHTVLYDAIKK